MIKLFLFMKETSHCELKEKQPHFTGKFIMVTMPALMPNGQTIFTKANGRYLYREEASGKIYKDYRD